MNAKVGGSLLRSFYGLDDFFWFSALQILINFLQVTGIAVFINLKWTKGVLNTLGVAGKNLSYSLLSSRCIDNARGHFVAACSICVVIFMANNVR